MSSRLVRKITITTARRICGDSNLSEGYRFLLERANCANQATHVATEPNWVGSELTEYYLCTVHAVQFALTGDWLE